MKTEKEQAEWLIHGVNEERISVGMAAEVKEYLGKCRAEMESCKNAVAERDRLRGELEAAKARSAVVVNIFKALERLSAGQIDEQTFQDIFSRGSADIENAAQWWSDFMNSSVEQIKSTTARAEAAEAALAELREVGRAVVDRWDSPKWKDQPHTGEVINRLRAVIDEAGKGSVQS